MNAKQKAQCDGLDRLTRMIRAADDLVEAGDVTTSSAPKLQAAAGDKDDREVKRAAEVLDKHLREEFLREFHKPPYGLGLRDGH